MYRNRKFQLITCISILAAIIFFPFHLFAQESKEVVEQESGYYYTVQKGDTLWDLSERFADSPWLWPDLWSYNDQISNPHWIYPGERIRLFYRKGSGSFVIKTVQGTQTTKEATLIEPPYYYYSLINSIGFIKKEPATPLGIIFKAQDDKKMISQGDLVYIRQKGDTPLILGDKYTVYRTLKPIHDQKSEALIGIQHYLTGTVEITNIEPGFALARVVQSFRDLAVNDLLIPYKKRSPKIPLTESKKGLNGKIVKSEDQRSIIGSNIVAFIDKGSKDEVKLGQLYDIYYQAKHQLDQDTRKDVLLTPVVYGTLLVLHAEQTTSTVLITQSDQSISPGATFGSPME
ncbi:MAG: hypothetical protein BBJ57_05805 [Desulfobacterales bacterium PC51MH44]|nr:MAG: hypothetical protein BBJ57_05805 [Desulfobacterales bacterium PC51MH44]